MWKYRARKILISYRRADTGALAGHLAEKLKHRFGASQVFIDVDNIPYGVDFRDHIRRTLEDCDIVIAVIGPHWSGDGDGAPRISDPADYLRIEIETALQLKLRVIPVLVDRTTMPASESLPPSLQPLAYLNAAPLSIGRDFRVHTDRIIEAIRRYRPDEGRPSPTLFSPSAIAPDATAGIKAPEALEGIAGYAATWAEWCLSLLLLWLFFVGTTLLMPVQVGVSPTQAYATILLTGACLIALHAGLSSRLRWRLPLHAVAFVNAAVAIGIAWRYREELAFQHCVLIACYLTLRVASLVPVIGRSRARAPGRIDAADPADGPALPRTSSATG